MLALEWATLGFAPCLISLVHFVQSLLSVVSQTNKQKKFLQEPVVLSINLNGHNPNELKSQQLSARLG